jgi:Raf kinase inhibitor-like YbhB/YbcL family protein
MNKFNFVLFLYLFIFLPLFSSDKNQTFNLSSISFHNKSLIPLEFVAKKNLDAKNISPPFLWKNIPLNTKSFAFICIDTHPIAKRWIHWMVINIPANIHKLPIGASGRNMPPGSLELTNSFKKTGWVGPFPPKGSGIHKYLFIIYALNTDNISSKISNEKQFYSALKGKVIAKAKYYGLFSRK